MALLHYQRASIRLWSMPMTYANCAKSRRLCRLCYRKFPIHKRFQFNLITRRKCFLHFCSVLSQCNNTRLRLLHLLQIFCFVGHGVPGNMLWPSIRWVGEINYGLKAAARGRGPLQADVGSHPHQKTIVNWPSKAPLGRG